MSSVYDSREKYGADYGVNHCALEKRCRSFQRQRDLIIKRTDYGKESKSKKTKEDNDKLANKIKRNSEKILTKNFAQFTNSQSTHGSGRNIIDNDSVLIVKPKEVDNEKFP
ncbi:hypothetical protein AVEN_249246-1 [Araneus ventricosus]|uniref:Uncharacterized protein n=1 Tax=Araneus ventricosus TaxID=182803 RepID=A0A4Y2MK03_ARAVE|nr:hypothetical protein AVEN_249246-1 [Araneus ventricosus]